MTEKYLKTVLDDLVLIEMLFDYPLNKINQIFASFKLQLLP